MRLPACGNPSSVHSEGRASRENASKKPAAQLAHAINAKGNQIVFTSGATEAASHALSPVVRAGGRDVAVSKLYVSAIEHPCVLTGGRFAQDCIEVLPVPETWHD